MNQSFSQIQRTNTPWARLWLRDIQSEIVLVIDWCLSKMFNKGSFIKQPIFWSLIKKEGLLYKYEQSPSSA